MKKIELVQGEREKIITNVERGNLDSKRLEELQEFANNNNPLEKFDEDLFRKLIRYVLVHNRNEIEFFFNMGFSRIVKNRELGSNMTKRELKIFAWSFPTCTRTIRLNF